MSPLETFSIGGKTVTVFPAAEPGAPVVYFNTLTGEGQTVREAALSVGAPPFTLAAISGLDWNHDLAPWDCPPVFRRTKPCTGGADAYLRLLTDVILPAVEEALPGIPRWRGIAGYSLAGLFAVYAVYGTGAFARVASVSGSLWFPGFLEYVVSHSPQMTPERAYFSLGERESKAHNPMLRTVRQNTEEIQAHFQHLGSRTVFRLHPGNHYDQAVKRTAAGIAWLLGQ